MPGGERRSSTEFNGEKDADLRAKTEIPRRACGIALGGNIVPVENLAESLQVAAEAGAKRLLLPMASVGDIPTIPGELFAKFQTSFYSDPKDAGRPRGNGPSL